MNREKKHRSKWCIVSVLVGIGMGFASSGCGGWGGAGTPVKIALRSGDGAYDVRCFDYTKGMVDQVSAERQVQKAQESGKSYYELTLARGALLAVTLERKVGDNIGFPYPYRGSERQPLVFTRDGFKVSLNGKLVCVDLTDPKGIEWVRKQARARLRTVRSVIVKDQSKPQIRALSRFTRSGVLIGLREPSIDDSEFIQALVAIRPSGLLGVEVKGIESALGKLASLRYLGLVGPAIPDLSHLSKLKLLDFRFDAANKPSLSPLGSLTQLDSLAVGDCEDITDFSPVGKLKNLRHLTLTNAKQLKDLSAIGGLVNLRSLTVGAEALQDISGIANLQNLIRVGFAPLPETVKDLTPLSQLKNLKLLVVDEDGLEQRKEEYDKIREDLPEVEIIGFCVGSRWILLIFALAIGIGLLWRRRARKAKALRQT